MSDKLRKIGFTPDEMVIYEYAKAFYTIVPGNNKRSPLMKFVFSFFRANDPRNCSHWKYFEKLYYKYKDYSDFDIYWFIRAQLNKLDKNQVLWPAQLLLKKAETNYKEYIESQKLIAQNANESEKAIIEALKHDYELIKNWKKDNNIKSYKELFEVRREGSIMSDGIYLCLQGMISKPFMAISKSFLDLYVNNKLDPDIKEELISKEEIKLYRGIINHNDKIKRFVKEKFASEAVI